MNRTFLKYGLIQQPVPRTRGDEPIDIGVAGGASGRSPHPRG